MRLTTKGRFAVTAMIDIGLRVSNGPVTLAGIAERQQISLSYLEQLFAKLRRKSLVEAVRGPGGGYTLSRTMDLISVADIITSVDETIDATSCGGKQDCGDGGGMCMTHDLWESLNQHMFKFLDGITLDKLVAEQIDNGWTIDGKGTGVKKKTVAKPMTLKAPNSVFNIGSFSSFGGKS
ncbi:MAG: putative transcriptional regulator IscR (Fe-S cluster-containing transcription factor), Rrf2 family [Pseudomonadota bacterium]|jgi:Rrf2 family iron-sulfur cluster assembly transcriptional regulator